MHCLRLPNAFPIADVGLHNAIKNITSAEEDSMRLFTCLISTILKIIVERWASNESKTIR